MGVKISALSAVSTPLGGTEAFACVQTSTKKATAANIAEYAVDVLLAASAASPTTGDDLVAVRSGTEKLLDLDALAVYAVASAWSEATEADPTLTGDKVLVDRSGTVYWENVDTMQTYILAGMQATSLDISGLDAATLADADQYLVVQGSTAKKSTWTNIAARAHDQFATFTAALDAAGALADANSFYVLQSGVAKEATMTQLATYMLAENSAAVVATAWDGDSVDPILAADVFPLERSNVLKKTTSAEIGAYATSLLAAASVVAPAGTGDWFLMFRGGTEKLLNIDVLSTYLIVEMLSEAATVDPVVGTDLVLMNRASALVDTDVDDLATYILTGIQADVLDIDGLTGATLADANYLYVQDGTAKQKTLGAVATYIHAGFAEYVGDQADADPIVDTDLFMVDRSDATKYIAASDLMTYMQTEIWDQTSDSDPEDADILLLYRTGTGYLKTTASDLQDYMTEAIEAAALAASITGWNVIDTGDYTATPSSTSEILMSDTTNMDVGYPLRYTYGGTAYYGIVNTVTTDTSITVRGATLNIVADLTELAVGLPSRAETVRLVIPGSYLVPWHIPDNDANADGVGDSENDETVLSEIARQYFTWRGGPARLVAVAVTQATEDDTVQPKFGVTIDSTDVLSQDSNKGIQVSATPGTWTWNSAVAIATGGYAIDTGDALDVVCTTDGSSGEAQDASLELVFVYE